jgi:4-amino-4-deoxy-L-arabinose transferase-like glycosyltransferase
MTLGRLPTRIVLGCLALAVAWTALMMVQDSDGFLLGVVAVGFVGAVLAVLPALVFLFYGWRRPPPDVPRGVRTAIHFSAVVLLLVGVGIVRGGTGLDGTPALIPVGAIIAGIGILTVVKLARTPPASGADTQLTYGRSSAVGAFLLLLVVVMVPKFAGVHPPSAYRSMLESDLRNLVTAQEAFFADSLRYASRADLGTMYSPTSLDSITIVAADRAGWRALGSHPYLVGQECGVWVGVRPPDGMHDAKESEPTCWKVS